LIENRILLQRLSRIKSILKFTLLFIHFLMYFKRKVFYNRLLTNKIKLTLLTFLLITFFNLLCFLTIFYALSNKLSCITICLLWTMMSKNKLPCVIIAFVTHTFWFKLLMLLGQLMHSLLTIFYTRKIIVLNHNQPLFISNLAKLLTGFPSNTTFKAISNFQKSDLIGLRLFDQNLIT
jgi:hypothetical protein